jgi:hypothetical protein
MVKLFLINTLLIVSLKVQAQQLDNILDSLDFYIKKREVYSNNKTKKIKDLLSRLKVYKYDGEIAKQHKTNTLLFKEYQSYIYDSAFYYIEEVKNNALKIGGELSLDNAKIDQSFVLLSSGLFKEAIDSLELLKPSKYPDSLKFKYYTYLSRAYFDLADYSNTPHYMQKHVDNGIRLLDSSFLYTKTNSINHLANLGLKYMKEKKWEKAKIKFKTLLEKPNLTPKTRAIGSSSLAYVYLNLGKINESLKYFADAAIDDIKFSNKETVALRNISNILFKEKISKKAYDYLKIALEEAEFYNARHRKIEIAEILPIIEEERLELLISEKERLVLLNLISVLLIIAVVFFTAITLIQLRKLKRTKKIVDSTVKKLKKVNFQLKETNKIKEDYIGYFFNVSSEYIDKLEKLHTDVSAKVSLKKFTEIRGILDRVGIKNERKLLYRQFDRVFLEIFPNFIKDYNLLFKKHSRTAIDSNDLLNSELRIFGLIRLGISDNEKIARFLDLSITTVYTYKTKAKSRSIEESTFFDDVLSIKPFEDT